MQRALRSFPVLTQGLRRGAHGSAGMLGFAFKTTKDGFMSIMPRATCCC